MRNGCGSAEVFDPLNANEIHKIKKKLVKPRVPFVPVPNAD